MGRLNSAASSVAVPVTDNSGSLTVDNAGTFATQATLQAGTADVGKVRIRRQITRDLDQLVTVADEAITELLRQRGHAL